ncbi:MAG: aminomethyl-transferring glycine dehydrogenase [Bacteroidota bacterium]
MNNKNFSSRHIGSNQNETNEMLKAIGSVSIDELIDKTIPNSIRLKNKLNLPEPMSEEELLANLKEIGSKNLIFKSYIGQGFYNCYTPTVILRNILENPGWYTQYTPYQAEISQGRLESLLNFQTMICDLTGMEIANASLLDEGTAAAEAMTMAHNLSKSEIANKIFVSKNIYLHVLSVMKTRALPLGIEVVVGDIFETELDEKYFAIYFQYPDDNGELKDFSKITENAKSKKIISIVGTDLLALTLFSPPGEFGADIVLGNSQRFGVPLGYGGPHAAFFATKKEFVRSMPGRIIGISVDANGNKAYRMTLQTREQHIRREKATSNICTAQALLANISAMYAVYHGADGLKNIATQVFDLTKSLANSISKINGCKILSKNYFDTLLIEVENQPQIKIEAEKNKINFRFVGESKIGISLDETTTLNDIQTIADVFCNATENEKFKITISKNNFDELPKNLIRTSKYLTHSVFSNYQTETEMLRYLKRLENKDFSLAHGMIPLGSCTMKLNATTEMIPITWNEFGAIHPFAPKEQTGGYQIIFSELEKYLCEITGFDSCSLQPNSGAQGEYAGLLVIHQYHLSRGDENRNLFLIPSSAHGTNPASAVLAGFEVSIVKCDEKGNIDLDDLKLKAESNKNRLAGLMVTYPSTHGVFEENIREITKIVHDFGGQVYMDGANLNAQVGLTQPFLIDADVCHINLHKTFAIPHGGGGPGMGPICVKKHLAEFLPTHPEILVGGRNGIGAVSSAPWGSASILLISYAYIKMLGANGLADATKFAILNANYLKTKLEKEFTILYKGENGFCAHEFILDLRNTKINSGVDAEDISKRLMDYGFHAPTVSFPVHETMMIEPTESESKFELDRFIEAMFMIKKEIAEIENGIFDKTDNVLKNAPHTSSMVVSDNWSHKYSREKAVFPIESLKRNKFWPSVGRVNNSFGDRNLICTCPPIEDYEKK